MDIGKLIKKLRPASEDLHTGLVKDDYHVAGVSYYTDNIKKLACCNPDWKCTCTQLQSKGLTDKKVFRYNFINKPVKLTPEKNPHDKNAVVVLIAGEKVGYISREENIGVRKILDKNDVKYISAFIHGGQYKVVRSNGEMFKDEDEISITVRIAYS